MTQYFLLLTNLGAEWVMWLLAALSLFSVAVMFERFLYFYHRRIDIGRLRMRMHDLLENGDYHAAQTVVARSPAIEMVVLNAGLNSLSRGPEACAEAMLSAKANERVGLENRLALLGTIGSNSPFVGLLGTVLGIIKAAHDLADQTAGQANANAAMAGVFEALAATAVGLIVAIPAVVAFNYFQRKARTALAQADSLAHLLLSHAPRPAKRSAATAKAGD